MSVRVVSPLPSAVHMYEPPSSMGLAAITSTYPSSPPFSPASCFLQEVAYCSFTSCLTS